MLPSEHDSSPQSSIRLIRDADVPVTLPGGTFRYSPGAAALVAMLMISGGVALIAVGRVQGSPLAYYIGGILLLLLWIYQTVFLARFRPTNWLVRVADRGVFIKFRSYLNHHFPEQDATVVYIPFREMRLTRVVRESQSLPDRDRGGTMTRRRTVVEIELRSDSPEIVNALTVERGAEAPRRGRWFGSSSGKFRHYPVRMLTPRTIALEWGVVPRVSEFLRILAVHTPVEASKVMRDYTALGALKREEQESRLLELIESGQVMDAIRLARRLYGYDLPEAKTFVEGLGARAKV